jgi:hypothetical protein
MFAAIRLASSLLILFRPPAKPLDDLVCASFSVAEQVGQLGDIRGNPPRLVFGE